MTQRLATGSVLNSRRAGGRYGLPRVLRTRSEHRIYVRDYPGKEPAIVLMHGFPDNVHLYDRLLPYLSPSRRVIAFDFLGWGSSDKPSGYAYTASNQTGDLDAVITQLRLDQVVLSRTTLRGRRPLIGLLITLSALRRWCC